MNKKLQFNAKILKSDGKKITVIASDETLDRHGEVLKIEDWDLSQFIKAPRMLIDHDHRVEKIVGRWENPRIEDGMLLLDANFHDITELSRAVHKMVEEDHLNSVSIGAIYNAPDSDGQRGRMELIETSWVTVGANPNALVRRALELNDDTETVEKVKNFLGIEKEVEKQDEEVDKDAIIAERDLTIKELNETIDDLTKLYEKQTQALIKARKGDKALAITKALIAESVKALNQAGFVINQNQK